MMQIGDLVKYKKHIEEQHYFKGVWLVINVELASGAVELVTLKQGNEQRLTHPSHLDKISSSR